MEKDTPLDLEGITYITTPPAVPRVIDMSAMSDAELASLLRGRIAEAESGAGVSIQQVREGLL